MNIPVSPIQFDEVIRTKRYKNLTLVQKELGLLNVPTGVMVASDPLVVLGSEQPFVKHITPGKYPVSILAIQINENAQAYALAHLQISDGPVSVWEYAVRPDDEAKLEKLKDGDYLGFAVDAGLGCFADDQTQKEYDAFTRDFVAKHPDGNIYDDFFAAEFKKNANPLDKFDVGQWLNFTVPGTEDNVIMFQSGDGDGIYPAYWGLAQDGTVRALVIDFQLLDAYSDEG